MLPVYLGRLLFKINVNNYIQTVEIFNAVGSSIDDYVATAVVGIVQLVATGGKGLISFL